MPRGSSRPRTAPEWASGTMKYRWLTEGGRDRRFPPAGKCSAGPDMDPVGSRRQIGAPLRFASLPDGRHEKVSSVEISILNCVGAAVALEMEEQRSLRGKSAARSLGHKRAQIWRQMRRRPASCRRNAPGHPRPRRVADYRAAIAFVRPHDRRKGRHLGPTHHQFGGSNVAEQARISADVGMMIGDCEKARG